MQNLIAAKSDLACPKGETDKTDVDKLKAVLVDLSKLSNVVNNEVVKEAVYDTLVAGVNNIGAIGFLLKTKYDTNTSDFEKKFIVQTKNTWY